MPTLTLAHSPDPDDVFMWWPLGTPDHPPAFDTSPFRFEPLADDIQVLNRRAIERGDLDITAISIHTYPLIRERYRLTDCAGSFGENYGPRIVVRDSHGVPADPASIISWLREPGRTIAVPGFNTTAYLVLRLMVGEAVACRERPFHEIAADVAAGRADAGLLIHDAQLTHGRLGLREVADLGRWWHAETDLPLPLGGNAVRRDLDERFGRGSLDRVASLLTRSITHALTHREEGMNRIAHLYPDLDRETLDRYLGMYVSPLTVSAGERGLRAMQALLDRGRCAGLGADPGEIDVLAAAPHPAR